MLSVFIFQRLKTKIHATTGGHDNTICPLFVLRCIAGIKCKFFFPKNLNYTSFFFFFLEIEEDANVTICQGRQQNRTRPWMTSIRAFSIVILKIVFFFFPYEFCLLIIKINIKIRFSNRSVDKLSIPIFTICHWTLIDF